MKGNLSKKKGFLRDLDNADLSSIADILEVKYGDRLAAAESEIDSISESLSITKDLATSNTGMIELYGQYLNEKENKENKVNSINTQLPSKEKYPSEHAVNEYGNEIKKNFDTQIDKAQKKAEEAYSLAAGAGRAIVFENYNVFCQYILDEGENFGENYPVGTTILIGKSGVPDLWYYGDSEEYIGFVPDEKEILSQLTSLGWFNVGYYKFAQSENQNIVLDGYATTDDLSKHADNKNLHTTAEEKQKWNAKLDKSNQNGGFVAGNYQEEEYAQDTSGVIIGKNAQGQQPDAISPVVIGEDAGSNDGVAIGYNASSLSHGTSVGVNAIGGGVSIGYNAKTLGDVDVIIDGEVVETLKDYPINAVQIGEGTNKDKKTVQFYGFKLLDKDGNIPAERLKNASGGGGGNVDLSDYYTKEQIDEKIGDIETLLGGI